jgi:hypothetical protein
MARPETLADKDNRKWKYILLLDSGGAFFGDTLWVVFKQIIGHRFWYWKRGKRWAD